MKLHLPPLLLRSLFAVLAFASVGTVEAALLHSDVSMQTYADFGQNMGRYAVGNTNALLQHLNANGVSLSYTGGQPDYYLPHGMIDFSSQPDNGASASIGYNYVATVKHNGVQNPTFTGRYLPEGHSIRYQGIEYRDGTNFLLSPGGDYKLTRLSKLVTDVDGSITYGSEGGALSSGEPMLGTMLYRAGAGSMSREDAEGEKTSLAGAYQYITGGVDTMQDLQQNIDSNGTIIYYTSLDTGHAGVNSTEPLPYMLQPGDSGSPAWVWNESTGQYEYFATCQGAADLVKLSLHVSNPEWTVEAMSSFDVGVGMGAGRDAIYLGAVDTMGATITDANIASASLYSGAVTDAEGRELARYNGVSTGINAWKNLRELRDSDTWYSYGSEYLNAGSKGSELTYADFFHNSNLVISAESGVEKQVVLSDTVDLGIGYVQFSPATADGEATFIVRSEEAEGNLLNSAGYIVDKGVSVHLQLTNPADYMREWRKVGEGSLYIEGRGNNDIFLNVGGRGATILNREGGYAAYNVLVNNGSTVLLSGGTGQIYRDLTFGYRGGMLDMSGHSMLWNNAHEAKEEGFTIHALDEQAIIANLGGGTSTLEWTQGGEQTWLGSFTDSATGALRFVYNGGEGSKLSLHSIHTNLQHADSGIEVRSGHVLLSGTNTVHGTGSATGTDTTRYSHEDDWHYADTSADVHVANGATFELGSHARLTGDVNVEQGGIYIMREGVTHRMEYIEGGYELEDTDSIREFFGHKGNVSLDRDANMRVSFSEGTDSTLVYNGNISGEGNVWVDAKSGILRLGGTNSSTGTKIITSGGLWANGNAALGDTGTNKWVIEGKAWLSSDGFTEASQILSHIDGSSTGVLALSRDVKGQIDLSEHLNLIIGAAEGCEVHYGTAGEKLTPIAGKWTLGGGGGNLIVDFQLSGENNLVLGNAYGKGNVHLSNSANDFTGNIITSGGVTLSYAAGALGNSRVDVNYGSRFLLHPSALRNVTPNSSGVLMLDSMGSLAADLSGHSSAALGSSSVTTYSGSIILAEGAAYRFGGMSGTLTIASRLEGGRDIVIDGQGFVGGSITFTNAAAVDGRVTIRGVDPASGLTEGSATLSFAADNALANASALVVEKGGMIDLSGTSQGLRGVVLGDGGLITDSSATKAGKLTLLGNAELNGRLELATVQKSGGGELKLGGDNSYERLEVTDSTVLLNSGTGTSATGTLVLGRDAVLDMNGQVARGSIVMNDGATLTNLGTQSAAVTVAGNAALNASNGTLSGTLSLEKGAVLNVNGASLTFAELAGEGTMNLETTSTDVTVFTVTGNNSDFTGRLSFSGAGMSNSACGSGVKFDTWQSAGKGTIALDGASFYIQNVNTAATAVQATIEVGSHGAALNGSSGQAYYFSALAGSGTLYSYLQKGSNNIVGSAHFGGDLRGFTGQLDSNRDASTSAFTFAFGGSGANYHSLVGSSAEGAIALFGSAQNAVQLKSSSGKAQVNYEFGYADEVILNAQASGRANVTQAGTGRLILNQQNSSSGTLTVLAGGTLELAEGGSWQGALAGAGILVNSNTQQVSFSDASGFSGSLALASGSSLSLGSGTSYSLNAGQSLSVFGAAAGSAVLTARQLTLNGGELVIHGNSLHANGTASLNLNGTTLSFGSELKGQKLTFSGTSSLAAGDYLLVSGDWSGLKYENIIVTGMGDYFNSALSTGKEGLKLTLSLKDGIASWDGTATNNTWDGDSFGAEGTVPAAEGTALFTDAAQNHNVRLSGDLKAGVLIFNTEQGYALSAEGNSTLEAADMQVFGGGTVQLGSGILVGRNTSIEEDSVVVVEDFSTLKGTVRGEGEICIAAGEQNGRLDASLSELSTLRLSSGRYDAVAETGVDTIVVEGGQFYARKGSHAGSILLSGNGWSQEGGEHASAALRAEETTLSGALRLEGDATMAVTGGAASALTGSLQTGEYTLTLTGGAVLNVNSTNVSGHLKLSGTGTTLALQRDLAGVESFRLGAGTTLAVSGDLSGATVTMEDGAQMQLLRSAQGTGMLDATISTEGDATISGSMSAGAVTFTGAVSGRGTLGLTAGGAYTWTMKAELSDAVDGALSLLCRTNVEIDAMNSFSGGTMIEGGCVTVSNERALGGGALSMTGGTLQLASSLELSSLTGSGGAVALDAYTLSIGQGSTADSAASYAGSVGGNGSLVKLGAGRQSFSGSVSARKLSVQEGSLGIAGSGAVSLGSAVTLTAAPSSLRSRAAAEVEGSLENVTVTETAMVATDPANRAIVSHAEVEVTTSAYQLAQLELQGSLVTVATTNAELRLEEVLVDSSSSFVGAASGAQLMMEDVTLALGSMTGLTLEDGAAYGDTLSGSQVAAITLQQFSNVTLRGELALDASGVELPAGDCHYVAVNFGEGVDASQLSASATFRNDMKLIAATSALQPSVLLFRLPANAVPEPTTAALSLLGLAACALRRRRK